MSLLLCFHSHSVEALLHVTLNQVRLPLHVLHLFSNFINALLHSVWIEQIMLLVYVLLLICAIASFKVHLSLHSKNTFKLIDLIPDVSASGLAVFI